MTKNLYYHRHLTGVAEADIGYVLKKDAQYDASWKRRGGQGAFFTFARPWDRLENIARTGRIASGTADSYDIFKIVEEEGLAGPDGSFIACVRDMRRYLLLFEAECIQRVQDKEASMVSDTITKSTLVDWDLAEIERRIESLPNVPRFTLDELANGDIHTKLATEMFNVPPAAVTEEMRRIAKARAYAVMYGNDDPSGDIANPYGDIWISRTQVVEHGSISVTPAQAVAAAKFGWRETAREGVYVRVQRSFSSRAVRVQQSFADRSGSPEDGGHHAAASADTTWPWVVDKSFFESTPQKNTLGAWRQMALNVWVLEPRITAEQFAGLLPAVAALYSPVYYRMVRAEKDAEVWVDDFRDEAMPTSIRAYWLRIELCPPDERVRYRELPQEANLKEATEGLQEYVELYSWRLDGTRYILRESRRAWLSK